MGLGALAAIGLVLFPVVVHNRYGLNVSVYICIYLILAAGLVLLFGYANQMSFGHAGFYGIGAYVSALTTMSGHVSVWIGMALGAAAAAAAGYAIGRPILRLRGLSLAMATFAFGVIMNTLFTQLRVTGGANGLSGIPEPVLGPLRFSTPGQYYWLGLLSALAVMVISWNIARSHVGRALRALGASEAAAQVAGIDVAAQKTAIFTYSAALAGFAGALYAHYVSFISENSFSIDFSILVVVIIAIGGMQSLWGAVLGAAFLAVVPELLRTAGGSYATLLYGVLLTFVFMYMPRGLVGLITRVDERVRSWRTPPSSNSPA